MLALLCHANAWAEGVDSMAVRDLAAETELMLETSATAASGTFAPLWLTSNRYGLGSVEPYSNYERARVERPIGNDDARKWGLGFGMDVAVAFGHARSFVLEQAYVEGRYRKLGITLGAKQQPIEARDVELTSGGLSLGPMRVLSRRPASMWIGSAFQARAAGGNGNCTAASASLPTAAGSRLGTRAWSATPITCSITRRLSSGASGVWMCCR